MNLGYVCYTNYLITINVLGNYNNYVLPNNMMHLLKKDYALYTTLLYDIIEITDIYNNSILELDSFDITYLKWNKSMYYYKNKNIAYDRLIYNIFFLSGNNNKYNHSGYIKLYHSSGNLHKEFYHNNDKIEGIYKEYYENGEIKEELNYINNIIYDKEKI